MLKTDQHSSDYSDNTAFDKLAQLIKARKVAYRLAGVKLIAVGISLLMFAVLMSMAMSGIRGHGTTVIASGAIGVSIITFFRGIFYLIKGFLG
jgi:uncharacterized membrane protein YjjP (DUF1212 family)